MNILLRWFRERFRGTEDSPTFGIAQFFFLRGVGMVYLIAIVSWWVQVDGLVGSKGIVPMADWLAAVKQNADITFWQLPTLFLWNSSDVLLHWTCLIGSVLAVAVIAGFLQGPCLALLWLIYLSLVHTGSVFMSFQWDILLLETGLLAILFAPWRWWIGPRRSFPGASRWIVFLLHFLLWKLMFFSGVVKIASDATWRDGTALLHHYETQPIAHAVAWYAHQLPTRLHLTSSWIMLAIEIVLPFAIFLGRKPRLLAFCGIVGLMVLIAGTGNFTYFNLLTIILCLPLLDDSWWPGFVKRWFEPNDEAERTKLWGKLGFGIRLGFGVPILVLSLLVCERQLIQEARWLKSPVLPGFLSPFASAAQPFFVANGYGLFRVMTRERPEILIEGSYDGQNWIAYEFRWKPDRLDERPRLVAPHQPRMDWQMWFAALGSQYQRTHRTVWFENLMVRLLHESPEVNQLFRENPFPDRPPRFVRAKLYRYEFTTFAERKETGNWGKRQDLGLFFPPISLRSSFGQTIEKDRSDDIVGSLVQR